LAQLNDLLVLGNTSLIGNINLYSQLNINNTIIQGSPSADSTITNMNRFQTDLFIQGNGSAPNTPKIAGFYLGKSQSDENRHLDIVSGSDYSYIDFNKASAVEDFKVRLIVNVTTGLTEMNWGGNATNTKFQVNGAVAANTVAGAIWNDYAEYRKQKENIKPGYCVISADNGEIYKTTEKF
jgi:hypothetical protein